MEEKMANFNIRKVERSAEEQRVKEAILAPFSEVADGETDESDGDEESPNLGPANVNAESIAKVEQERREQSKLASQAKKREGQAGQGESEETRGREEEKSARKG